MTSPDGQIPDKAEIATTVYQLQNVDQNQLAILDNQGTYNLAELARQAFVDAIYSQVQQIPVIGGLLGDLIEVISGVEDGDLSDVGTFINSILHATDVNNLIAAALHLLGSLLDNVPIVGDTLEAIVNNIAAGLNTTDSTATSAHSTALSAQSTATSAQGTAASAQSTANSALSAANSASTTASGAVTAAQAAADAAAAAQDTADTAYANAQYWEAECVVASAGVLLGVNELAIGLCQNVPTGFTRKITDLHFALSAKPGTMVIETKKWNAAGTSSSVIHTTPTPPASGSLNTNVVRQSYNNLNLTVLDKERVFWNVLTSSQTATVLQVLVFGVMYPTP